MTTMQDWTITTSTILTSSLPGATYENAKTLVQAYLLSIGGWNPDDPGDPSGNGEPVNGYTSQQAATAILAEQFSQVKTITTTVPVTLTLSYTDLFASGTTDAAAAAAVQEAMLYRLQQLFSDGTITLGSANWGSSTYTVRSGSSINQSARQSLQTAIAAGTQTTDPANVATVAARQAFSLDSTWMASTAFTTSDVCIYIYIDKYTSTTYASLDTPGYRYIVRLNVEALDVQGITKLNT